MDAMDASDATTTDVKPYLERVTFPATKDEMIQKVGDERVPIDGENVRLGDLLEQLPRNRYQTKNDVQSAVQTLPRFRS